MDLHLYENAMQVVPILLIALFLGNRDVEERHATPMGRSWDRAQDKIFAVLGVVAFYTSMFVVAGVVDDSPVTMGIVIAALSGSIALLFVQIWAVSTAADRQPLTPARIAADRSGRNLSPAPRDGTLAEELSWPPAEGGVVAVPGRLQARHRGQARRPRADATPSIVETPGRPTDVGQHHRAAPSPTRRVRTPSSTCTCVATPSSSP